MGITSLEINNYKGISKLKFNPTKINLIIGKNNTGKTSVLDAIGLLLNNNLLFNKNLAKSNNVLSYFNIYSNDDTITLSALINNDIKKITITKVTDIEIIKEFSKNVVENFLKSLAKDKDKTDIAPLNARKEMINFVEKSIDNELKNILITNSLAVINENNEKVIYYGQLHYYNLEKIEILVNALANYFMDHVAIVNKINSPEQKEYVLLIKNAAKHTLFSLGNIFENKSKNNKTEFIYINSLQEKVVLYSFLQRLPEDAEKLHSVEKIIKEHKLINNLEKLDFDNVLFSTDKGIKGHSFSFLGDGFKSIIGLIWELSDENINNKIVLLDEPENHLHPGYIKELLNFILEFSKKLNIQFFITTHSLDVLDILLSGNLEKGKQQYLEKEFQILKMSKINESILLTECLNYSKAKEIREELSLDLRGI